MGEEGPSRQRGRRGRRGGHTGHVGRAPPPRAGQGRGRPRGGGSGGGGGRRETDRLCIWERKMKKLHGKQWREAHWRRRSSREPRRKSSIGGELTIGSTN
jgi:hypothetical protein